VQYHSRMLRFGAVVHGALQLRRYWEGFAARAAEHPAVRPDETDAGVGDAGQWHGIHHFWLRRE